MAKKSTIDFALIEIDVQHYKKQGYVKVYACNECHALVTESLKADHAGWHNK